MPNPDHYENPEYNRTEIHEISHAFRSLSYIDPLRYLLCTTIEEVCDVISRSQPVDWQTVEAKYKVRDGLHLSDGDMLYD